MDAPVKHPRALAVFRAALYLAALGVVTALVLLGLSVLGFSLVVAGLSLVVTGDANAVGFALLAGAGLLTTGGLAVAVGLAARRVDRYVTAANRHPDPLDELTHSYVVGELDETAFEHRVERVLTGETADPRGRLSHVRNTVGTLRARAPQRRNSPAEPDRETESEPA